MARAAFAFVVPDGAQPGGVIQVPVLGILGHVKLPEGTFAGQRLTIYSAPEETLDLIQKH